MSKASHSSGMQRRTYLWSQDGRMIINQELTATLAVKRVVNMMGKLMRSRQPLCLPGRYRGRPRLTPLGREFVSCLNIDFEAIATTFPVHRHSPYFLLFERYARCHLWTGGLSDLTAEGAEEINSLGETIRTHKKDEEFAKGLQNIRRCVRKSQRQVRRLLASLRSEYSKILVVRVDLGYHSVPGECGSMQSQEISTEEVQRHRDRLMHYLRRGPLASSLAGYAWRLEYGFGKGHHFHVAVFYNGQNVAKDIRIADMIGAHWREVTGDRGRFFSCNKNKEAYEECGIGMVSRSDDDKWSNVEDAVCYLTKEDYYLRFRPGGQVRTFGVGGPY